MHRASVVPAPTIAASGQFTPFRKMPIGDWKPACTSTRDAQRNIRENVSGSATQAAITHTTHKTHTHATESTRTTHAAHTTHTTHARACAGQRETRAARGGAVDRRAGVRRIDRAARHCADDWDLLKTRAKHTRRTHRHAHMRTHTDAYARPHRERNTSEL